MYFNYYNSILFNINSIIESKVNLFSLKNFTLSTDSISIYILKFDPYYDNLPWMQSWFLSRNIAYPMLLDNLFLIKNIYDEYLSFRRSCREGICGSCAMNINGINTLACTKSMKIKPKNKYFIFPLPHMAIIKDLIVSMNNFYSQYKTINPFLIIKTTLSMNLKSSFSMLYRSLEVNNINSNIENIQLKENRLLLDGLYECILCACCSTSCPSYWWNQDSYLGPAVLLQAYRWIIDSRDDFIVDRLTSLDDAYKLYRCHTILNCVQTCPKNLSPARAISNIKSLITLETNEKYSLNYNF